MDEKIYRKVLDQAGYTHAEPTEEAVRSMFSDYVSEGFWSNIEPEDVEDFTTTEICAWFIRDARAKGEGICLTTI